MSAEQAARHTIDDLLQRAGWVVADVAQADIHASGRVAMREFPLADGYDLADYPLLVDGKAAGIIEAKKRGAALTGVDKKSGRYAKGLPASLPAWQRPLPFVYETTGVETHFTNGLDPEPRARSVFAFHTADTLARWIGAAVPAAASALAAEASPRDEAGTLLYRARHMPELLTEWGDFKFWLAQIQAIRNCHSRR